MVKFVEPEFPRIFHISAYAAHQGGLVLRYGFEKPVIIGIIKLDGFRMITGGVLHSNSQERDRRHVPRISEDILGSGGI